jgi:hypothetical protein
MLVFLFFMTLEKYFKAEKYLSKSYFINWIFIWLGVLAVMIFGSLSNTDFIYFDF